MKKLPMDKIYHFVAGFLITAIIVFTVGPEIGLAAGITAGILKEGYDKFIKKTKFDFFDLYATIFGSVIGLFVGQFIVLYLM